MGSFRTRGGRCVMEHGELRLESVGVRGRFKRGYENAKRAHKQRYERSVLRFGFVVLAIVYSFVQVSYEVLFGDEQRALLGAVIIIGLIALVSGFFLLQRFIR